MLGSFRLITRYKEDRKKDTLSVSNNANSNKPNIVVLLGRFWNRFEKLWLGHNVGKFMMEILKSVTQKGKAGCGVITKPQLGKYLSNSAQHSIIGDFGEPRICYMFERGGAC
jgi:hypothetical protein